MYIHWNATNACGNYVGFDMVGTVSVLLLNTGGELDLCFGRITPIGETLCSPYIGNYDNDGKSCWKGFYNFQNYSNTEMRYHNSFCILVFNVVKAETSDSKSIL
jgi:hypothetical protein